LNTAAQDRIQVSGDLLQWQKDLPDLLPHTFERLWTVRWEKARKDLPTKVSGHAWPETGTKKRKHDLGKLAPSPAVLGIDHLGLLGMQL
jgi:hypothetical protein